jgi:hypothetical protein
MQWWCKNGERGGKWQTLGVVSGTNAAKAMANG